MNPILGSYTGPKDRAPKWPIVLQECAWRRLSKRGVWPPVYQRILRGKVQRVELHKVTRTWVLRRVGKRNVYGNLTFVLLAGNKL